MNEENTTRKITTDFNPLDFCTNVAENFVKGRLHVQFGFLGNEHLSPDEFNGPWGQTDFDKVPITITIDPRLPMIALPEILMHEIAHAIAGYEHDHGEAWDDVFKVLHEAYTTAFDELCATTHTVSEYFVCDDCGVQNEFVDDTFCPYSEEIHHAQIPAYLCGECYYQRCLEI